MDKIIFVGDLHLDSQTPVSRLDDYRELTITKLNSLLDVCIQHKVSNVICTGDFFDKYDAPISYLSEIAAVFNKFTSAGIKVYSIIGNHDLPYNNLAYFKTVPLSLLFETGLIERLDAIESHSTVIYGLDFTKSISDIKLTKGKHNLLVMHYALDDTVPGESIDSKELTDFDLVVAGHDHMFYEKFMVDKTTFLRPGSFTRRTKDAYNLTRDIILYLVDTSSIELEITELKLPNVQSASLVFRNEALHTLPVLSSSEYDKLFKEDFFKNTKQDIFEIVDSLGENVTDKAKKAVKDYLKNAS